MISCSVRNVLSCFDPGFEVKLVHMVGDIDAAAVPCGFGRAIGNKVNLPFVL